MVFTKGAGEQIASMEPTASRTRSKRIIWVATFIVLVTVRVPFLLTHHFLDDSFITFRTAVNLADHGVYSYNLTTQAPGTTSVLYALLASLVRFVFRMHFLYPIGVLNSCLVVLASWFMARTFLDSAGPQRAFWIATATAPTGLLLSYLGMETSLLMFVFCASLYLTRFHPDSPLLYLCLAALPLIRPDAISAGALLAAVLFAGKWLRGVIGTLAIGSGILILLLFNHVTTGSFVTGTMVAKELHYAPSHAPSAVLGRIVDVFFNHGFLMPIDRGNIHRLSPIATLLAVGALIWMVFQLRRDPARRNLALALTGMVVLVPIAYAYGGITQFPWYFQPSAWLAESVIAFCVIGWSTASSSKWIKSLLTLLLILVWTSMALLRLLGSFSRGTQNFHYMGDIGRYLAQVSHPGDTLFLEPAGLIPFFSGLFTDDEVGLVSPRVIAYHRQYPHDWLPHFVEDNQPTFIVERSPMLTGWTSSGYQLNPAERTWFTEHYCAIKCFHYGPAAYFNSPFLNQVLTRFENPVEDWVVFRHRDPASACTP